MDDYQTLNFEEKGGVAWIRMNRPDELNTLNLSMAKELCQAAAYCTTEKNVRAVMVTGTGRAFCAGGDIKNMAEELRNKGRSDLFLRDLTLHLHSFISEIARMPKPVVAAVNGVAAGAGFSISLACDMSIAAEDARFVMAYTDIGLVPDGSSTFFLSRLVGPKKAMELIYLNEPIDATEALKLGIVNRVLPSDDFEKGVSDVARKLAQGPTATFGRAKNLMRKGMLETLESQMENERQGIAHSSLQGEFQEGITAFTEKRKADFLSVP